MLQEPLALDQVAVSPGTGDPLVAIQEKILLPSGYALEKRIASGGSGEVWKATAPGGLSKAIKIVFGCLDDRRAAQELKALNRVKSLSHPFLLSLERIEIVDGRLIIVTELADGSLRDRFDECLKSGLCGIPREELIEYLLETAEALDFLEGSHGLQHLDVKPENLLLVAKHIKVADFGLLKDMTDGNASLINGLTPRYAAPEVFGGGPSRHSDQYSLAIVFQELATGIFPFSGRTAAQFASQHLHSPPDLTPLSPLERFAVGKALAKDPAARFSSCREFVQRLAPRQRTTTLTGGTPRAEAKAPISSEAKVSHEVRNHDGQTIAVRAPESASLPAIDLSAEQPCYRPAVFVGIGHTGGKILSRLKQLLIERFGLGKDLSAFQMLHIDTDAEALNEITSVHTGGKLAESETLLLPIHSTWNYRDRSVSQLGSISRRWVYNIPRSQKTEGLRALGRLALMDHAERAMAHLRKAILTATDRETLAATGAATGLTFSNCDPRVFVIASPSGGTGSGILIDAAYAIRQLLIETGLSDQEVIGILPLMPREDGKGGVLGLANTLACLQELQYYSAAGDYPGEIACGLAGFREELPTFSHTYFLDFMDRITAAGCCEAVNEVASYVLLNTVSPAVAFFDAARRSGADNPPSVPFKLRTFAVKSLGAEAVDAPTSWIDLLCRTVVLNWRGGGVADRMWNRCKVDVAMLAADKGAKDSLIENIAAEHASAIGLDFRLLYESVMRIVHDRTHTDPQALVQEIVAAALKVAGGAASGSAPASAAVKAIHQAAGLQTAPEAEELFESESLRDSLLAAAQRHGQRFGESLETWILSLVDRADCRVAGAQQIATWLLTRVAVLVSEASVHIKAARQPREQLLATLNSAGANGTPRQRQKAPPLAEDLRQYTSLLMDELTAEAALKCLAVIEAFVSRGADRLRDLWKDVNRLADEFAAAPSFPRDLIEVDAESDDSIDLAGLTPQSLRAMADEVKQEIESSFLKDRCSLYAVMAQSSHLRPQFVIALREAAKKVVRNASRSRIVSQMDAAVREGDRQDIDKILGRCLTSIKVVADRCSGATRLLLALPDSASATSIMDRSRDLTGEDPTLICDPRTPLVVTYEIEQVPPDIIVNQLIRAQPDCESLASRLHTRVDVNFHC